MSDDALKLVRACTHPQVKRSVRDLFEAIAALVPEGQTTTPPLTVPELAAHAQHSGRTAQDCRDVLEAIGAIKVHDGGRGKVARYEILNLDGARPPVAAALPLRADLREVKPRRTKEERSTSDLFSDVEDPTSEIISDVPEVRAYDIGNFFRRWWSYVGNFFRRWRDRTKEQRSTSEISSDVALPLDVDGTRARDVHTFKNVHTHAAPRDGPTKPEAVRPPPCRWFGRSHAWCDGRVHVPMELHHELVRKVGASVTATEADTMLRAFYARECAAVPPEALIGENDFVFWRRRFTAAFGTPATAPRAPTPPPRRPTFGAGNVACPHDPMCRTIGDCSERIVREARAAREEQTG